MAGYAAGDHVAVKRHQSRIKFVQSTWRPGAVIEFAWHRGLPELSLRATVAGYRPRLGDLMHSMLVRMALVGVVFACALPARAAEDDSWKFAIAPYLWLPSVDTEFGIDGVPLEFDA